MAPKKAKKATTAAAKASPTPTTVYVYVVTGVEHGAYREDDTSMGFYSTKKLALENAKKIFEKKSVVYQNYLDEKKDRGDDDDSYSEGKTWDENSMTGKDQGLIYDDADEEGDGFKVLLRKMVVDEPLVGEETVDDYSDEVDGDNFCF